MADKVAGNYFGRWANAEREVFELKNKLAKQQDIIAKVANGVITAGHDATSAETAFLKNESAMKQKQIEDLESSLKAKDTSRALEVEKLVAEINGLKLELADERVKQHEVMDVPGSKVDGDSENECAVVLTPASSMSEQTIDDEEGGEDGLAQHSEEAIATDPLVIGLEHDEQNITVSREIAAVVVAKLMTADEVFEAYAREVESLAEIEDRSVSRKTEKTMEAEVLDIGKKYQDLMDTALPDLMHPLDLNLETDVLAQKLIEKIQGMIRATRASLRLLTIDQREAELDFHLGDMERRMLEVYHCEKYPLLKPIIASFVGKLEAALRA
ncbi:hypothetical protein LTS10_000134 [Elasticomyces elasticus]|nr:hypothetical protein LTS10_000134 [Elasticomyces elasticus]